MLTRSDLLRLNENMLAITIRTQIISLVARRKVSENFVLNQAMILETEMLTAQIEGLRKALAELSDG
jgi:hypothetical protein